jgi:hypothetical protein
VMCNKAIHSYYELRNILQDSPYPTKPRVLKKKLLELTLTKLLTRNPDKLRPTGRHEMCIRPLEPKCCLSREIHHYRIHPKSMVDTSHYKVGLTLQLPL